MNANSTRYLIKIPDTVEVLNSPKLGYILIKGVLKTKLHKSLFKINLCNTKKVLYVTNKTIKKLSNKQKKYQKSLRGTAVALINQYLSETSSINYQKLNLIGVGYKVFTLPNKILHFKLGFSHDIYYKLPENLTASSNQAVKLLISGTNPCLVNQTAGLIKQFKKPEPYKGKGVLYSNEKIKLKEGKKV